MPGKTYRMLKKQEKVAEYVRKQGIIPDQIDKDIETIKDFLKYRSCGIRTAKVYDVYERYGFLDPQHDSPESAIEALELRKYEKREE